MYILNVPREQTVDKRVNEHHDDNIHQVIAVTLHWWYVDVTPLHTHAFYLVERKVFGTQPKRSCWRQWLLNENKNYTVVFLVILSFSHVT